MNLLQQIQRLTKKSPVHDEPKDRRQDICKRIEHCTESQVMTKEKLMAITIPDVGGRDG